MERAKPASRLPKFARFLIVGVMAVGFNMLLYAVLVELGGMPYLMATAVIFVAGNAFGFIGHRAWTFSQMDRPVLRLAAYYATMLASLTLNLISMLLLVDLLEIHYLVASLITSVWLAPLLYLAHGVLAFRGKSSGVETDVLMLTHYFPGHGGGVEAVADELFKRLATTIAIHWLATDRPSAHSSRVAQTQINAWNGIERRIGLPIPVPSLGGLSLVVRSVRRARIVWIHDLPYIANIVAAVAALAFRKPLLVTVHVSSIPYRNVVARLIMTSVVRMAGAMIFPRAAHVGFVSERVKNEFTARWQFSSASLIPNGIDTSVFRPMSDGERRQARKRLGVEGNAAIALFVGRFVERKGVLLLRELAHDARHITWVFAGDGPIDPAAWDLPNVRVLRQCSRKLINELYGAADIVVLPSIGEGFPLVVQEALATGRHIVVDPSTAAGSPGVQRFVTCESATGPEAAQRWGDRISRVLSEDRPPINREAVAYARKSWDWREAAAAYEALLGRLLLVDREPSGAPRPVMDA